MEQRFCGGTDNGKLENRKQATDGDDRFATGVLNFAHTLNGVIICLLSEPILNKSVIQ